MNRKYYARIMGIPLLMLGVSACGFVGNPSPTPSPTTLSLSSTTLTISGKSDLVLTTQKGNTLYFLIGDNGTTSTCSGNCTKIWSPLLTSEMTPPKLPSGFSGEIKVFKGQNGEQVAYNGHLLYTYSGDSGPNQTKGNGVNGLWFAVTSETPPQQLGPIVPPSPPTVSAVSPRPSATHS